MIRAQNVTVRSLSLEFLEVSWDVAPTHEDVLDYKISVLRGEGPMGPFAPVCEPFTADRTLFVDRDTAPYRLFNNANYVIRVTARDGTYTDTEPTADAIPPDLITLEIRRHFALLYKEHSANRAWLLPKKVSGKYCYCFNKTLGRRTTTNCLSCYDTGFLGGFHSPVELWCELDPTSNQNQQTPVGILQPQTTTGRCAYFPRVKPNDIIVSATNDRWEVVSVTPLQHAEQVVRQEMQLRLKLQDGIEYKVPLQLDEALRDMYLAPPRNYENPQDPKGASTRLVDALRKMHRLS